MAPTDNPMAVTYKKTTSLLRRFFYMCLMSFWTPKLMQDPDVSMDRDNLFVVILSLPDLR